MNGYCFIYMIVGIIVVTVIVLIFKGLFFAQKIK